MDDSQRSYFFQLAHTKDSTKRADFSGAPENLPKESMDLILNCIGREVLREKKPPLQELEQILKNSLDDAGMLTETTNRLNDNDNNKKDKNAVPHDNGNPFPLIRMLVNGGYLTDDDKWLTSKGFMKIGNIILEDVMRALKVGEVGSHGINSLGPGSTVLDTNRKYEIGDDTRLINIPLSLLNSVLRLKMEYGKVDIPMELRTEDFEEYETLRDVRSSVVYCIDLSSTMRYSKMFGEMSRIEAAKKALWSLVMLNKKYFPNDSVYVIGFGSMASSVKIRDIPYLKTFEAGSDLLHYTNYQAAFRLSKRILHKDGSTNKRVILVTDGHPSACFVDGPEQQEKILKTKPYSHFYTPDSSTLDNVKTDYGMKLDCSSGSLVYLCYRYRQVDHYIAEQTIIEAEKCLKEGVHVDTLMISEEDALLSFVNEMERQIQGRSYYVSPEALERAILTDFIGNKRTILHA